MVSVAYNKIIPHYIAILVLICMCIFVGALLILPFLPFMVSDFFPKLDRTEIGKKAGFLGSAFYIGCLGGNFLVSS